LLRAGTISGQNATIFTPNARLFDTTARLSGRLTVLYGSVSQDAQEASSEGISSLSIGNLSLPSGGGWRFCVEGQDCSSYIQEEIRGLYTLVAGEGSDSLVAEGRERGFLGPTEDNNTFEVSSNGSFFPVAYFIGPTPAATPTPSPSEAFAASAALPVSGPLAESFPLTDSAPLSAEKRGISVGILAVAIVVPLLAVVAVIVAFIVLRHRRRHRGKERSEEDDGTPELLPDEVGGLSLYKTGAFVTSLNPNAEDTLFSDGVFEDE
jgi:hypothetical protein